MQEAKKTFPFMLHQTATLWRNKLDKRLKPLGLSQAKWRTLLHLSYSEEPLTQTRLAQRTGIETATLVRLLDRLAKDGWIKRQAVQGDRRSNLVMLTEKSCQTLEKIHDTANQLREELLAEITDQELNACMKILSKIRMRAEQ
jgi:MarR family transcriptional regulator for hemolysin